MNATEKAKTKALNEKAEFELANHERSVQRSLNDFAKAAVNAADAAGGYGLSRLIVSGAEVVFRVEQVKRWQEAIRDCLKPECPQGLEDLLDELEKRVDRWTPNRSTSLLDRAEGEAELEALRVARQLVRSLLKANAS